MTCTTNTKQVKQLKKARNSEVTQGFDDIRFYRRVDWRKMGQFLGIFFFFCLYLLWTHNHIIANADWVSSGGAGAMASMMALDPAQRRVLFIDYHFCDTLTSTGCLLKVQRPEFWKPLYRWSSYLLSHSFFRRVRKEPFSTPWILVSQ